VIARCTCEELCPPDLRPSERLERFVADVLAHGGTVRTLDGKAAKKALRETAGWTSLELQTRMLFDDDHSRPRA
jgi:hypothetical protein